MSLSPIASLKVTANTTLDELQAFQESIGKDDAKLRGKVHRDGSITLKAVDRDSSFFSKMFGVSKKRRDAARSAINMVMTNSGAVDRKPIGSLNSLVNADRKHSPKSAMLRDLVAFAKADNVDQFQKASETPIQREKHLSDVMSRPFTTLESKGVSTARMENYLKLARDLSATGPMDDGRIQQFANEIRTDLYAQLTQNGPLGLNERAMLGVSDIEGFVNEAIARAVPQPHTEHVAAALDQIAKGVSEQLSNLLLGSRLTGEDSFQLNGETYTRVEVLGQGGFGRAELYRGATTGREVVLKVPGGDFENADPLDVAKAKFDFKAEIDMHTKIMEGNAQRDPHVLSFEGAVRLPNGMFATVTEACTSGSMSAIMSKLDEAVQNGSLTPGQAMACKLTLMRDMVEGQAAIFQRGFSHRDVKFQNVFVSGTGTGKVADFGETAFGRTFALSGEKLIENSTFLAPENLQAQDKIEVFEHKIRELQYAHMKAKVEVFNGLVGPGGAFAHLGIDQLSTEKYEPAPDDTPTFQLGRFRNRAEREREGFDSKINNLGEVGAQIKAIINDLTQSEARLLQAAAVDMKSRLPTSTLINGGASDVWSFGTAILNTATGPGQAINALDTIASENELLRYITERPVDPGNGLPVPPLPEALVPGSFLTDDYQSPHPNGTVTGDPELDQLVNQCLRRDPNTRPTFAQILQNPIFQRPGVGDQATRDVIAALGRRPAPSAEDIQELAIEMAI